MLDFGGDAGTVTPMARLPASLNIIEAKKAAVDEVIGEDAPKSPAREVGEIAETIQAKATAFPGISFQGEAPSRLSEAVRAEASASWRVTGNYTLLLLALTGIGLTTVEVITPESELSLTPVVSALVVVWVVCQVMRLVMIMGYGQVRLAIGSRSDTPSRPPSNVQPEADAAEPR